MTNKLMFSPSFLPAFGNQEEQILILLECFLLHFTPDPSGQSFPCVWTILQNAYWVGFIDFKESCPWNNPNQTRKSWCITSGSTCVLIAIILEVNCGCQKKIPECLWGKIMASLLTYNMEHDTSLTELNGRPQTDYRVRSMRLSFCLHYSFSSKYKLIVLP